MVQLSLMRIRFGELELDEQRFLLQRDGVRVQIRPKVFELLVHLIRYRDRVVMREELIMALWGTTAVGLGSLSGLVNELRQVLGEAGRGPSSIRTVHARGYQFVAAIESHEPARPAPAGDDADATVDGLRYGDVGESPWHFEAVMGPIRASYARVAMIGAQAVFVEGKSRSGRCRVLDDAIVSIAHAGFEIHRLPVVTRSENPPTVLVDRLIGALIECHGLDAIRSAIPPRAHALLERSCCAEMAHAAQPPDPLAARQVEEGVWRSTAELLCELARRRPIALIVDELDPTGAAATPIISALLRLLGKARVFILATLTTPAAGEPEAVAEEAEGRIVRVQLAQSDHSQGTDQFKSRTAAPLPKVLVDTLVAHVREGNVSIESIARWLRAERAREEGTATGPSVPISEGRMRRVEPDTALRRPRMGRA
jgi:DNA-binding winged helix-turn-helix (wHTH) protein